MGGQESQSSSTRAEEGSLYPPEIHALVSHALESTDLDIVHVAVSGRRQIRVVVDRDPPGPVTVHDLTWVSRTVAQCLHEHGFDPRSFDIQCQSPGADRILARPKDFQRFQGRVVRVRLRAKKDGRKSFTGQLLGWHDGKIFLRPMDGSGDRAFDPHEVAEARIVPGPQGGGVPGVL